jgi:phospho-N-acetylmuramoyl-pentapeptide-transferase
MILDTIKIFVPSTLSFIVGIFLTPLLTRYLYKHKMWKKKSGKIDLDGNNTPIFNELHKEKEVGTPRMGGIIIWASAIVASLIIWLLARFFPGGSLSKLDFISRNQTWIPLCTLLFGSLVGLIDDFSEVSGKGDHIAGGMSLKKRLLVVGLIGLLCALWFYFKLEVHTFGLPFLGDVTIGWLFIPFFVLVTLAIYSGGVIDGLDGLAGGVFSSIFAAYSVVAFYQHQIDLAAFCAVVVGGILAFLWFNIPPARFYMSETGTMGLTITLAVVAFMTDSLGAGYGVVMLPVIALPLVLASGSVIIQLLSKKFRHGKKVFRVAPLHHHYEALGWPASKVTMRFWIISVIFAVLGVTLAIIG